MLPLRPGASLASRLAEVEARLAEKEKKRVAVEAKVAAAERAVARDRLTLQQTEEYLDGISYV